MPKILEWVRWGLAVLVIPLCVWGIKLEVNRAVMDERVAGIEQKHREDISRLEQGLKEAKGIDKAVQDNNGQLIKLSTQMEGMADALDEIKELLRGR